jgi:type IV pilus assembly protein PilM
MKNIRRWFKQLLSNKYRQGVLGIDINDAAVRIVELIQDGDNNPTHKAVEVTLAPQICVAKSIQQPEALIAAIKLALKQLSPQTLTATVAVPDTAVMSKIIQLDASLIESEIAQHINLEANHYFHQPIADICIDFAVLGLNKDSINKIDVQLTAARRKEVGARVDVLRRSGLEVKAVDIESHTLIRLLQQTVNTQDCAVIFIDKQYFLLIFLIKSFIVHIHTEYFADDINAYQLAAQIAKQMQLALVTQQLGAIQHVYLIGQFHPLPEITDLLNQHDFAYPKFHNIILSLPFDSIFVLAAGLTLWNK